MDALVTPGELAGMFDALTFAENSELWTKLLSANKKFRGHAEYLINLAERGHRYMGDEIDAYLLLAGEVHPFTDELTTAMRTAV